MFTIHYEDSDGCEPMSVGVFDTNEAAVAWMHKLADTKCPGCDVRKWGELGFERVEISHPTGCVAEFWVMPHRSTEEFETKWNV